MEYVLAIEATGMNLNFLLIILAILAIILTAMCVLTVYRRRRVPYSDKDIDCDIRENIINYDDEGGGEGDGTGYDLSVLRLRSTAALGGGGGGGVHENGYGVHGGGGGHMTPGGHYLPPGVDKQQQQAQQELPGVGHFLDETKDRVDQDPEATPYDDLRHYAYEGDGNSGTGSLSSLNSGSEADQDLEFEYLHNFGPRFKKLADMYGRETETDSSSSEGENNLGYNREYHEQQPQQQQQHQQPAGSESWC
ncbi:MAG: hypothetical protein GY696_29125 [Gammaproteobacteria bacterium]|nr:hypothetical protein [Gammaproteobacteria bacterium]